MTRGRRPSIFQVGQVREDGNAVVVSGWGLGPCASGCVCHRDPATGSLALAEDQAEGLLGLVTHRDGCDCCQPWTAAELGAVVRDLERLSGLDAPEPLAG
ncbi:hypothetical protein DQ238_06125 [Geodermatophilus sp. TF02-6]|uniref:hypothetical protein n=1 Tax=Geodermatophilus sp. TF02-6 TaxID=2250575 RepID=UPI000DE972D8|nr:hypothetical protein [Geodermatophilus sp. TF02-6]RBY81611.1 hypothetical protein DQ238_06125 [Geodermatophilus sp. TF02-6]